MLHDHLDKISGNRLEFNSVLIDNLQPFQNAATSSNNGITQIN